VDQIMAGACVATNSRAPGGYFWWRANQTAVTGYLQSLLTFGDEKFLERYVEFRPGSSSI